MPEKVVVGGLSQRTLESTIKKKKKNFIWRCQWDTVVRGTSSGTGKAGASAPVPPPSAPKAPCARRSRDARDVRMERRGGHYCAGERMLLGFRLGFWGFGVGLALFGFVWFCLFGVFVPPAPRWSAWFFTGWKKLAGHKISGEACTAVLQKMCVTDKSWYRRLVLACRTARIAFSFRVCFVLRTDSDVLWGSSFGCITFVTGMAEAP